VIVAPATKNTAPKNHPKDILCDENYLYRIILVHLASNIVFTTSFRRLDIELIKLKISSALLTHSLTHCLTTDARLETK